jgi:hypothetical protein
MGPTDTLSVTKVMLIDANKVIQKIKKLKEQNDNDAVNNRNRRKK